MNGLQKLQQKVWRSLYPFFPWIEHHLLSFHESKRQRYHIGYLAPGHTLAGLKKHLSEKWGFGNHFVAWEDKGQVLSWRKLASFNEQYHLRVFSDGEICGHYELTPEASPIRHFLEKGETSKTHDFLKFLGEFVTTKKYISHVEPDTSYPTPDSEITFEETAKAD